MSPVKQTREPFMRQALGQSTLENRPFPRPLSKKASQKFACTPSKVSFTPRSSSFNPSSRPSTPSSARKSRPLSVGETADSPVPELGNLNRALTAQAWVSLQIKAFARYPPPEPALLLTDSASAPTSDEISAWTSWMDGVEVKLEKIQVVELPRLVSAAKSPTLEIETLTVELSVLPLLKTLRTRLAARRDWIELVVLSAEWRTARRRIESLLAGGGGRHGGMSTELLALASIANRMRLAILSAKDLRSSMSTADSARLTSDVLAEMDRIWWDMKASVDSARGAVAFTISDGSAATDLDRTSSFVISATLPALSPSGTASSLDQTSTASESTSLRTLSPANSTAAVSAMSTKSSLPNIIGYQGSEAQKRAWFILSRNAALRSQEEPFALSSVDAADSLESPSGLDHDA